MIWFIIDFCKDLNRQLNEGKCQNNSHQSEPSGYFYLSKKDIIGKSNAEKIRDN
jgi:hypothetical protein